MAVASARPGSGQPMMEMNTTPLIDVMLVLLIMFIMTIPMATNSTNVDLPSGGATHQVNPVINRISVSRDGAIRWNGQTVSEDQLATQLRGSLRLPVEPELQFHPDADASYEISARVIQTVKASGVTKFGFVDNEKYAEFGKPVR